MKIFINSLFFILLVSCGVEHTNSAVKTEKDPVSVPEEKEIVALDSTELNDEDVQMFGRIRITPHIVMDSTSKTGKLTCGDANYWGIVQRGKKVIPFLIEKLKSAKPTLTKEPCGNGMLTEGTLAFILLEEILNIPYFTALEVQYDVLSMDCMFPSGLIEDVTRNPEWIHKKLHAWYLKSANQYKEMTIEMDDRTDCQIQFGITTKLVWED